jgi:hypothetical protein
MILTKPPAVSSSDIASLAFSSSEPGSTFECALDNEPWSECESPAEYSGLAPGRHVFLVRATDLALNVDETPARYEWTVVGPPETFIDSSPIGSSSSSSAAFAFSSDQANVTFLCSLDGIGFTVCESPVTYAGLIDGVHTFEVVARNSYGVVDETPAIFEWTVAAAPDTTIDSGPPAVSTTTYASFNFYVDGRRGA